MRKIEYFIFCIKFLAIVCVGVILFVTVPEFVESKTVTTCTLSAPVSYAEIQHHTGPYGVTYPVCTTYLYDQDSATQISIVSQNLYEAVKEHVGDVVYVTYDVVHYTDKVVLLRNLRATPEWDTSVTIRVNSLEACTVEE